MDDKWPLDTVFVRVAYSVQEVEQGCGMSRHTEVGPGYKVELAYFFGLIGYYLKNNNRAVNKI